MVTDAKTIRPLQGAGCGKLIWLYSFCQRPCYTCSDHLHQTLFEMVGIPMNIALKIANYVMAAAFLLSVLVQYNDPDPVRWMAMYGAAMIACILFLLDKKYWYIFAGIGFVALLWALDWAPGVIGKTQFSELFAAWEMKNERVEEAREFGGLMIVVVWMAVLTFFSLSRSPRNTRTRT